MPGTDGIEALAVDGTGRLWVVGTRTLRFRDPGGPFRDATDRLPAPPFASASINRERDGSLGIPTNAGLLRLRGDDHEVLDMGQGLPCTWTTASLLDREGSLWVLGPALFRQLGRGFTRAFTSQDGLPSDLVWQVYRTRKGRLFAGTSEGLAELGAAGWKRVPGTEGLNIASLGEDASGRLLIGPTNASLRTLDPGAPRATDAFLRGFRTDPTLRPDRAQCVLGARDGAVWISDPLRGILRLDPVTRTAALDLPLHRPGVPEFICWSMAEDAQGRVWAATTGGLFLRDAAGWRFYGKAQGLKVDPLNGVALAPDGTAWVLYREPSGVTRVEIKDGVLKVLEHRDTANGLGTNVIYAAAVDSKGALWMGTDIGVECVQGRVVLHVSRGGGLVGDDCSQGGIFLDADQDVWVGTTTGLGHLVAARRPATLGPLSLAITQVTRGRTRLAPPFGDAGPVRHRDATVEFRFAAQSYVNEKAVAYQVRLEGLEEDWRGTDVPQARYAALPAGDYRFEVRAAYPGRPFSPPVSYPFRVLPPWWATWWCRFLEALALVGLAGYVVRWRTRSLAQQKERLAGLVDQATADLVKANRALEEANLALQAQSLSDPLTGLHNRRYLSVVVDDDLAKVQRAYRAGKPGTAIPNGDLVFFVVDLDHFKEINDRLGHRTGDRVLELTAKALRKAARETDAVVRWGGEEFLVMARGASRAEAPLMAERIRAAMAAQALSLDSGERLAWTCSIGYAAYPFSLEDPGWMGWEKVVEIADACLYLAKRGGRDGWAGAEARPGLSRFEHGPRLPWELNDLAGEGVLGLKASRPEALKRPPRTGEVFG
jgi:diguanylate cyclase (GGDEF)-like protein